MASIAPTRRLGVGSGLRGNHFRGPVRASYRTAEAPGLRLELAASRANANACSGAASATNRLRLGIGERRLPARISWSAQKRDPFSLLTQKASR
jgi:hypothetical protein